MTVSNETATRVGVDSFKISWDSSLGGTQYVYRDGLFQFTTTVTEFITAVVAGETPVFEMFDSEDDTPTNAYSGFVTLSWPDIDDTAHYIVQENVSAVWTTRRIVIDDGSAFYTWKSRFLEDDITHQFRVKSVDAAGNESTATTLSILMVRNPNPPALSYLFNPIPNTLTVSEF